MGKVADNILYMSLENTPASAPAEPPVPGLGDKERSGNPFKPGFHSSQAEALNKDAVRDAEIVYTKELRVGLDGQLQKLKSLPPSRERSLSITKIQEAIMWLGMDLKRLNDTRPYPNSYDPTNTKVDPTADNLKL